MGSLDRDEWGQMEAGPLSEPACRCEAGVARVGGARVTDTSQRSGPVFAGRDVRFRQI